MSIQHPWNLTPSEAIALQKQLRDTVVARDDFGEVTRVAGVDCGFEENGNIIRAAVAMLEFPSLRLVDQAVTRLPTQFPYIPGLLSFREIPALLAALDMLNNAPDLILVDGQGLAHPRRFGIACHLGVLVGIPTIGAAKSRLTGTFEDPGIERGNWTYLLDKEEIIGAVLRTRRGTRPLFVSPGHRVGLESAIDWVLRCTPRYRLPETTRQAHRLASG
ncbi:deoxyribonuclease V [Methyloterricola oryzae]|uniref:deoxyribonuclease V n=1 Tax=Methyloterricola oryzae TaxID=1495050 RepID=UPI000A75382E|nr:deoxyribonuclease V [Methyloterricola oryzae]